MALVGRQVGLLHQRLELEGLRAVDERRSVDAAADHDLEPLGGVGDRHRVLEDGNHPVLAAGVLLVVVVHVRFGVADERRIVIELLFDHRVELGLRQAVPVLDGVAAGGDRVLETLAAEIVAPRLVPEAMRLVNQRLQNRQGIGQARTAPRRSA